MTIWYHLQYVSPFTPILQSLNKKSQDEFEFRYARWWIFGGVTASNKRLLKKWGPNFGSSWYPKQPCLMVVSIGWFQIFTWGTGMTWIIFFLKQIFQQMTWIRCPKFPNKKGVWSFESLRFLAWTCSRLKGSKLMGCAGFQWFEKMHFHVERAYQHLMKKQKNMNSLTYWQSHDLSKISSSHIGKRSH